MRPILDPTPSTPTSPDSVLVKGSSFKLDMKGTSSKLDSVLVKGSSSKLDMKGTSSKLDTKGSSSTSYQDDNAGSRPNTGASSSITTSDITTTRAIGSSSVIDSNNPTQPMTTNRVKPSITHVDDGGMGENHISTRGYSRGSLFSRERHHRSRQKDRLFKAHPECVHQRRVGNGQGERTYDSTQAKPSN